MLELDTATQILDSFSPKSLRDYRDGFRRHMMVTNRREKPQSEPLHSGIDCGRWIVNCVCGGGIALHPDWQFAACLTCGRSWSKVIFPTPEFMARLEVIFRQRPPGSIRHDPRRFWSWWPDETLEQLTAENIEHGWTPPRGAR